MRTSALLLGPGSTGPLQPTPSPPPHPYTRTCAHPFSQETAATDVRYGVEWRCSLPQKTVAIETPWGPVGVRISFKGSEVFKVGGGRLV